MPHVITVLAPGFEETEAVTVIDLLRRADVKVTVLGLESIAVRGSHGITLYADSLFNDFSGDFDGIVLPGGMPGAKNLAASAPLLSLVRETHRRNGLCAAICAAPMVLGKAGILAGFKATCYPGFEKELSGATFIDRPVVSDRNVITSRGLGTAVAFGLELVSYLAGQAAAQKIGAAVLYQRPM